MQIERIHNYQDGRFPKEILWEHGAFLVDGNRPCMFKIKDQHSATVFFDDYTDISEVIDEFRAYAEHITIFYDTDDNIIAEYPSVALKTISLNEVQPSQFFVDLAKVDAVSHFIRKAGDVIIPVTYVASIDRWVSLDGHSRMYYASTQGWMTVQIFESKPGLYISGFVDEARQRGVFSPKDIIPLQHRDYEEKWFGFCDDFFSKKDNGCIHNK